MKVGLIAHDSKKKLMQNLCIAYRGILSRHELYATGTTGTLVEEVTNLRIHKFLPGETGGTRQLASQIEQGNLDLIIFLRDPLHAKAKEPEVSSILRLCDIYNIPIATNLATAELLIKALERGDLEWRNIE
ncbi:MAG: methylglyoxal synthase [Lachnospiraceae bacterium]|nr:methylglyoxal synthase [Oribacterium sp.]MDY6316740.1 methylglyoxal synthase [Oribacterium sp.]MEE3393382.1 methylglyoxal synthase [Lachnospiraceae bacterium]MEE3461813.1 methylglyoxal synthase [Lachnospiraceae bacterium]